jgi:energy-coupling factor transporter ATP-binding protein EcfA2
MTEETGRTIGPPGLRAADPDPPGERAMPAPLLSVRDLSFRYPAYPNLPAGQLLRGLNLDIHARERCLVLGRPECGKTTLSRLLAGLVPRYTGGVLGGRVLLAGQALADRSPCDLLEDIGLAFQNPEEQLVRSRCDSEVAFGLEALGLPASMMRARVGGSLELAGLSGWAHRGPATLSGGEKKKLLLACLMALRPAVWLLDETLEELDIKVKQDVLELLRAQGKTCLVFSSKWHRLYAHYFSSCYLLAEGRLIPFEGQVGGTAFTSWLRKHDFLASPGRPALRAAPQPPESGGLLLEARNLVFRYPGGHAFSLQLEELTLAAGETLALIGPNGSGKSTLGKLLCGLLAADGGEISVRQGSRWLAAGPEQLNRFCGYMFQNPDYQIFLPEVRDELAYGLKQKSGRSGDFEARISEAIDIFGLPGPKAPPSLMSYGARKRLQAAVYYLLERPLLILDEGDSGISAADFTSMVGRLSSPRRALVIITHDLEIAARLADRVLSLRDGRLQAVETGADTDRLEALVGEER